MLEPFQYPFVQRGLVEILLLSVGAGVLGTWIVLRGLSFYAHAIGTAAFPGLVLAEGLAFSPFVGALGAATLVMLGVERLARRRQDGHDVLTALVLVGALSLGVILASDVFHSGSSIETLLFGSLLLLDEQDLVIAGCASAAVLVVSVVLGGRWLAIGFDRESARSLGVGAPTWDALLLAAIALSVVSALSAVGALLTGAVFVVPAATVRLWTRHLRRWQVLSVMLAAVEGVVGLWLSVKVDVPPGPAIAVLGGVVFAVALVARSLRPALSPARVAAASALVALALVLAGCSSSRDASGAQRLSVVATTTQLADWVRLVGGDAVAVHQILQPNTDPHDYEPRPSDVEATSSAAVVFESGDGLDEWMDEVVGQSGGHPTVDILGDRVPIVRAGDASGTNGEPDPHWWHDPRNAEVAVGAIRDALARADPGNAPTFRENADAYVRRLKRLDAGIATCIDRVPIRDRKLVTDHDAFGYFAARYGLTVVGAAIPSQTTQAQPSAGELADLIDLVDKERVRAVFPERSLSAKLAQTIARETDATARYQLYGDSLGPEGSSGATYLSMELANTDAIVRGLTDGKEQCAIPGIR